MKKKVLMTSALLILALLCGVSCMWLYAKLNPPDGTAFWVNDAGYYDLLVDDHTADGKTGTGSLFIGDRYVKKVRFGDHEGEKLRVPVYFDRGLNIVEIRSLEGDGDIVVEGLRYEKRDRPIKMVLVPHQDDEILGFAASIHSMMAAGDDVRVVFMTNGDIEGPDMARIRFQESTNALKLFGVEPENITFLGYPDGGLMNMSYDLKTPVEAASGEKHTYADPDKGIYEYHWMQHGRHAELTGANARGDLFDLLTAVRPAEIYLTSRHEMHGDHYGVFEMAVRTIQELKKKIGYEPLMHETVIHGYNDSKWPVRTQWNENGSPVAASFTNPFPDGYGDFHWESATHIPLTSEVLRLKQEAIEMYYTQNVTMGWSDYNFAFLKDDEFYWTTDFS